MNTLQSTVKHASYFELDYIAGSSLPKSAAAADWFVSAFQACAVLDTLTGESQLLGVEDSQAIADWKNAENVSLIEVLKRAEAGEPRDRVSPRASFEPLNEWEGYVVAILDNGFAAHLLDLTAGCATESDEATFSIDDVSDDDRGLVGLGAIFRWSVGYERQVTGTRRKVSSLVFRRLPIWTKREISESREKARSLVQSITWE